jgi:nitrogen regulatory protein PII
VKLVVAFVRPEKLEGVQEALTEPGVCLLSVSQANEVREPSPRALYRGLEVRTARPRLRLEVVVVNETLVSWVVDAIARVAATNEGRGLSDGDILILPLDECVRIAAARQEEGADAGACTGSLPPLSLDRRGF